MIFNEICTEVSIFSFNESITIPNAIRMPLVFSILKIRTQLIFIIEVIQDLKNFIFGIYQM